MWSNAIDYDGIDEDLGVLFLSTAAHWFLLSDEYNFIDFIYI